MSNTLLSPQVIANETLRRFRNNLGFASSIHHEYDDRFANKGAKTGESITLRQAVIFAAEDGAPINKQNVVEKPHTLTINRHKHVAFEFPMSELALTIDRFSDRYLQAASAALANAVDVDLLTSAYKAVSNFVGVPGTVPTAIKTYSKAGAWLDKSSAPIDGMRHVVIGPDMQVEIVDELKALFHSSPQIKRQYEKGRMGTAAGFDWILDQNIRTHTTGPYGGTPAVTTASQSGTSIATDGWTSSAANRLKAGDIISFDGVYAVNPVSGDSYADLANFVVAADFNSDGSGEGSITLAGDGLIVSGPYKNCSGSPGSGALINIYGKAQADQAAIASKGSPQGLAYHKDAFAWAMVPFEKPRGVDFAAVATDKDGTGFSLNIVSDFDIDAYSMVTRVDVQYGFAVPIPRFAVRVLS
jgi:hypothetical protein